MKIGDIVVNPFVSKDFDGRPNPMYATIYIGNDTLIDYLGRMHKWSALSQRWKDRDKWRVIGHYPIKEAICAEIMLARSNDAPKE